VAGADAEDGRSGGVAQGVGGDLPSSFVVKKDGAILIEKVEVETQPESQEARENDRCEGGFFLFPSSLDGGET